MHGLTMVIFDAHTGLRKALDRRSNAASDAKLEKAPAGLSVGFLGS